MEFQRTDAAFILLLTFQEVSALTRILRVVEDEWWLDELERGLLEKLEDAPLPSAA